MHSDILFAVSLLVIGSVCDTTMIKKAVQVPHEHWKAVESGVVKDGGDIHNLLFVSQHDTAQVQKLKEISDAVSYPGSPKYGHFLSYEDVYQSVLPKTTENGHVLEQWAKSNGLTVTQTTKNKQYIMVQASVDSVERVFQTKLQHYQHIKTGQLVLRSTSFVLPSDIDDRVALIDGLSAFPVIHSQNRIVNRVVQPSTQNSPYIGVNDGFGHYHFAVIPCCLNGNIMTQSFCGNTFNGFQINISGQSKVYNVSLAQSKCQVCSRASRLYASYCGTMGLSDHDVLCQFYLKQDGSIPLYDPHTFIMQTRFREKLSQEATYDAPLEKGIDITPPVLRSLYNVDQSPNTTRNHRSRQAIFGFQEYLDIKSFQHFAQHFGQEYKLVFGKTYGFDYKNKKNDETETSLDIQYMASMGFGITLDYISGSYGGFLLDFFVQLALLEENKTNVVPLVYSISAGTNEVISNIRFIEVCDFQFMIMSVTGKTVFIASGDTGNTGISGQCSKVSVPVYPASSAYVTSVGATQFVQARRNCFRQIDGYCLEEVGAETNSTTGCLVTSGGGFSNFFESPKYQQIAVENYLKNPAVPLPPNTFFHRQNRAYPDISLAGHQYLVKVFGNADLFIDGTSASSPAIAGLFSLIVDQRLKMGLPPLGLLNPLLYNLSITHPEVFYDITKGNTNCVSGSPPCCEYGFVASKGWDPVTGLGSINHRELMKQLTKK